MKKFARKCSVTGKGMNEGYCFGDGEEYAIDKKSARKLAENRGHESLEDAFEEEDYYWTTWKVEEGENYYDEDGNEYNPDGTLMGNSMTTQESNKLIAEFMGARPIVFNEGQKGYTFWNEGDKPGRYGNFPDGSTNVSENSEYGKYHSSWDWLMDVVEKINDFTYDEDKFRFTLIIHPDTCTVYDNMNEEFIVEESHGGTMIEVVYKTIIQFIQWYNENK